MRLNVETTIEETRVEAIVKEIAAGTMTKGAGIRECFAGGLEVKDIAAKLGIRYNHVYNVVKNEVLVHDLEVEKSPRGGENSKKAQIVQMLQDGKTITEISKELKCMYNYVWSVAKAAGMTKKKEVITVVVPDDLVPMDEEPKKGKKKAQATA